MRVRHLIRRIGLPIVLGVMLIFLAEVQTVREAVADGMRLSASSVVPSLFVFSVVSQLIVRMRLMRPIERLAAPFFQAALRLPGSTASAFLLGAAGGYPLGAQTVAALYASGQLSKSDAEEALGFCNNCGIAYMVSVAAPAVGLSVHGALMLYALHLLSALVTALLLRLMRGRSQNTETVTEARPQPPEAFAPALASSVGTAALSMLTLSGFICLFSAVIAVIRELPIALPRTFAGLMELSTGIAALETGDIVPAALLTGFGGLCVLCQAAASAVPSGLRPHRCLLGKLLQGLISAVGALLFFSNH